MSKFFRRILASRRTRRRGSCRSTSMIEQWREPNNAVSNDGDAPSRTQTIIWQSVYFTSTKVRNEFTSARTRLKGKSIFINDDLTPAEQARRRTLVPIFKSLKKNKKNSRCQLSRDRLLIDGKEQSPSEIAALCAQFNSPSSQPASSTLASLVASAPQSTPPALSSSA